MKQKPTKTFKMPKSVKRMLTLSKGDAHHKGEVKRILIQSILSEIDFKNRRGKSSDSKD